MSKPNKVARGSGSSKAAADNRSKRFEQSDFAKDMAAFQAGNMSAEAFKAKYDN